MILDNLNSISNYQGICPALDQCIQFILTHDLQSLSLGKTDISLVPIAYVSVFDYEIHPEDTRQFEAHRELGDIHFTLKGSEMMDFCDIKDVEITTPYVKDIELGKATPRASYVVDENHFAITFQNDAHQVKGFHKFPNVKKIVFKFQLR